MKKISPQDLVLMNDHDYRVELVYAMEDNLLFNERIYRKDARLYLHTVLADVVKQAAKICLQDYKLRYVLYDGLRTVEAQRAMSNKKRVKDNPHWLSPPRLLSPAGSGGHPRAMAVDIALETLDGVPLDMGCAFDYLAEASSKEHNPAHRSYQHCAEIQNNRKILDKTMARAARALDTPIFPLPQEWWDFRMPNEYFNQYAPISEFDLPPHMRLLYH